MKATRVFVLVLVLVLLLPLLQPASAFDAPIHDLAVTPADLAVLGANAYDQLGDRVAAGDFNGDGIDDLLVGANQAKSGKGEAYVFFGSTTLGGTIDLATASPDLVIRGADSGDWVGHEVGAGDVNGDGIDDLLVTAYCGDGPGNTRSNSGEAYVIFGSATLGGTFDLATTSPNLTVFGVNAGDGLGHAVGAGDVNYDGIDDLFLGAPQADAAGNAKNDAGEAYVIFGSPTLGGVIDLATTPPNLTVLGADGAPSPSGDQLGHAVAAGDVNGDGIDDFLVTAYRTDGPGNARFDSGEAYVIFGATTLGGIIDLATTSANLTVFGPGRGSPPTGNLGESVAAADLSGDGIDDLLLGAPTANTPGGTFEAGEAYVIFGATTLGGIIDLAATSANLTVLGADVRDFIGTDVAAGDINGDGIDDLLVTAWGADSIGNTKPTAGELHVVFGSSTLAGTIDLATTSPDLTILGTDAGDRLHQVAAGDFNGDGIDDLLAGAVWADATGNAKNNAGEAYVIFGARAVISVDIDIKPGSCPNPVNPKSKGVLPVAVLGTEHFDTTTIDPATIQLTREGYEIGVSPLRWSYEDVATPFEGDPCECHDLNGDGYLDLTLKFKTQEVKDTLDIEDEAGNTMSLLITGNLREEADGIPIEGSDCVWVLKKGKK